MIEMKVNFIPGTFSFCTAWNRNVIVKETETILVNGFEYIKEPSNVIWYSVHRKKIYSGANKIICSRKLVKNHHRLIDRTLRGNKGDVWNTKGEASPYHPKHNGLVVSYLSNWFRDHRRGPIKTWTQMQY